MFIDADNRVDKEGLRLFVLNRLIELKQLASEVCIDKKEFWDQAEALTHQVLMSSVEQSALAIRQLARLPNYIQTWIETSVDSPERLEFFVLAKANELHTGDQTKDYYWALQIRHDQLIALVRVLEILLGKMKGWITLRPAQLFDDVVFAGLTECGVEDQVYLEAEKVYQERLQLTSKAGA